MFTVAIDFDDTLTYKAEYPNTGDIRNEIVPLLHTLHDRGLRLALNTCRNKEFFMEAVDILKTHNLYDLFDWEYIFNKENHGYTGKLYADIYIDDKSMLCDIDTVDWNVVETYILTKLEII